MRHDEENTKRGGRGGDMAGLRVRVSLMEEVAEER